MKTKPIPVRTALLAVASLSTLLAAPPTNAGSGYALSFDGVNDWVDLQAAVIPASGDFTVECWVRCPTAPNAVREVLSQGSSGNAFYIGTDSANNFRVGDTWTSTGVPFPVGDWHHITVVSRTGADAMSSLYVDGERQSVAWRALANPAGVTGLRLGRQYGSHLEYWPGQIDEVRVWAVAHSTTEILAHMKRPVSGSEPHLVAYWRCNENGGPSLVDTGAHGYSGLPQNGTSWVPSGIPFVPGVSTGPATNITLTSAVLTGTVSPGNLPTTAAFQWGPDTSYGRVTAAVSLPATNAPFALTVGLSNLAAGVTYHFRLVATNDAGITLGTDAAFGTVFPASVATVAADPIGLDQATLNGTVNPHGLPTTTWFEWGTDTSYGNVTSEAILPATVASLPISAALANLIQGQTYHFRVAASNSAGLVIGSDRTFAALARPALTPIADQAISQGTSTSPLPFTVADADTTLDALTVTAHSANPVLVPNTPQALVLAGGGAQRTIRVVPATPHSGSAVITVTVSDGVTSASAAFTVAVLPRPESPLLQFTGGEMVSAQTLRFRFQDLGTGATNYTLDFLPDLSPGNFWTNASAVTITPLGPGEFQADLSPPAGARGFYRIKGIQLLLANFDTANVAASQGESEVNPVIVFNAPFQGTIHYTISGTAGADDFEPLSGEVQVNGTTAVIPVRLRDDVPTEFARTLILTLEGGGGFQLGANCRTSITLDETQHDWQGTFVSGSTSLGFMMRLQYQDGGFRGSFRNGVSCFFPTNEMPLELEFTADRFAATVANIPVAADATLFNTPMVLTLQLEAANGQTDQTVNGQRIQGAASLISQVPDLPHLNTTDHGTFLLIKSPAPSPTNQVDLVPAL